MKKFLITGIFLFFAMPAMALNLSPLYKTTAPDNTGDCSGPNFQNNSVTMQAVYVTDSCPAGYYFNVGANAVVDSTTGQVTDTSCQPCSEGHYCPNSTSITVNSNGTLESQGAQECLAGTYADSSRRDIPDSVEDPDYAEIIEEYKSCQLCPVGTYASTTGASECTTCADGSYASGKGNTSCTAAQAGYYALADHSGEAACTGATYASGTGNTSCTNVQSGHYATANHSGEETCPEGYRDADGVGDINECARVCTEESLGYSYPNVASYSAYNTHTVYYNEDPLLQGFCGERDIDKDGGCNPGYTRMYTNEILDDLSFGDASVNYVLNNDGTWTATFPSTYAPVTSVGGVARCGTDVTNNYGCLMRVTNVNGVVQFNGIAVLVASYNDPADCEAVCGNISEPDIAAHSIGHLVQAVPWCVPNIVNVNWTGVSLPDDDPARTCTYGEHDLTAPSEEQLIAPAQGYKFIGWTVR